MYWEEHIETLPRQDLEKLQVQRLRDSVSKAQNIPFYQEKFKALSIDPDKIKTIESLRSLPFTAKEDLRARYPYGMLAVPLNECIRVHASSGTTGKSIAVLFTEKDIEIWSNMVARSLYCIGTRNSDIFQNMAGYGMFTGGLGYHHGVQKLGALMIPASTGNSKRQVHLITNFGTTVVHCMPNYGIYLINVFREMGIDPRKDTKLKIIMLGAENCSEETRKRIETFYGVDAYDGYGLSEMHGPGSCVECRHKNGFHVWEDHYIVEVLEPDGDDPVPEGEVGEVVFTSLTKDAMPLLRYRTRDLASFIPEPCPCGRTHRRLSRIQGRFDDMMVFKGVNIFPMQIEQVLMNMPEIGETYLIVLETKDDRDWMNIQVEVGDDILKGDPEKAKDLRARLVDALQSEVLVRPEIQFMSKGSIPVTEVGKAKRVIDKRTL